MELEGPLRPGARHVSHTPAACSFPGENARSWEALGEARPGPDVGGGWKGEEYSREEGSQDSWAQREGRALRKAAGREGDKEDP